MITRKCRTYQSAPRTDIINKIQPFETAVNEITKLQLKNSTQHWIRTDVSGTRDDCATHWYI
jgi:hypothetical protein